MSPSKPRLVLIEQHNIGRDIFYTTPLFWDCECEEGYIHSCLDEGCSVCGVTQDESPNARVDEVLCYSSTLNDKLIAALEMVCDRVCPDLVSIPF
ncbi:MAG: hypothetical protein HY864_04830 [Chloroflexi bacterium]|nr:hypothetical protein [Chloroflexota bacterium]